MNSKLSKTLGILIGAVGCLIFAAKWRDDHPETFRGTVTPTEHPQLTPHEHADQVVEIVLFLRGRGIEPTRHDLDLPEPWPPEGWAPPEGFKPPSWWND